MKLQASEARSIKTLQSQNRPSAGLRFQISHFAALNGRLAIEIYDAVRLEDDVRRRDLDADRYVCAALPVTERRREPARGIGDHST